MAFYWLKRLNCCRTPWVGLIPVTTGVLSSDHSNPQSPEQWDGIPLIKTSTCKQHHACSIKPDVICLSNSYHSSCLHLQPDALNKLISHNHRFQIMLKVKDSTSDGCTCGLDSQTRRRSPAILRINNPPFFFSFAETTMFVPPNTDEPLTCNERELCLLLTSSWSFLKLTCPHHHSGFQSYNLIICPFPMWNSQHSWLFQYVFFYRKQENPLERKRKPILSLSVHISQHVLSLGSTVTLMMRRVFWPGSEAGLQGLWAIQLSIWVSGRFPATGHWAGPSPQFLQEHTSGHSHLCPQTALRRREGCVWPLPLTETTSLFSIEALQICIWSNTRDWNSPLNIQCFNYNIKCKRIKPHIISLL